MPLQFTELNGVYVLSVVLFFTFPVPVNLKICIAIIGGRMRQNNVHHPSRRGQCSVLTAQRSHVQLVEYRNFTAPHWMPHWQRI